MPKKQVLVGLLLPFFDWRPQIDSSPENINLIQTASIYLWIGERQCRSSNYFAFQWLNSTILFRFDLHYLYPTELKGIVPLTYLFHDCDPMCSQLLAILSLFDGTQGLVDCCCLPRPRPASLCLVDILKQWLIRLFRFCALRKSPFDEALLGIQLLFYYFGPCAKLFFYQCINEPMDQRYHRLFVDYNWEL